MVATVFGKDGNFTVIRVLDRESVSKLSLRTIRKSKLKHLATGEVHRRDVSGTQILSQSGLPAQGKLLRLHRLNLLPLGGSDLSVAGPSDVRFFVALSDDASGYLGIAAVRLRGPAGVIKRLSSMRIPPSFSHGSNRSQATRWECC